MHDIRHTTASILLARGVSLMYVSQLLGHSSPKITWQVYSHFMPSEHNREIDSLSKNVGKARYS